MREYNCLASYDLLHEISRILSMCEAVRKEENCTLNECNSCALGYICMGKPVCFGKSLEMLKSFSEREIRNIINRVQEWSVNNPERRIPTTDEIAALIGLKIIGYKYIAADKNGDVFAYSEKPAKDYTEGRWIIEHSKNRFVCMSFNGLFKNIAVFTDEEPMKIDKLITTNERN